MSTSHAPPILPAGTQVVVLAEARGPDGRVAPARGAVGVIVQSPADPCHSYRVRFPDEVEAAFRRQDLAVLKEYKSGNVIGGGRDASGPLASHDLCEHVIYRCVIGSRAYGLDDARSDTDRRGVYLPPASLHWSLYGVPEQFENPAAEEVYWETQKFLVLALKSNPNVLECLYTPLVEHVTPLMRELLAMRGRLISQLIYQTYSGYVLSQFRKLQAELRNRNAVKWKHVMHLIRLLIAGATALEEGHVPVDAGEHRPRLLAIKRGEMPFAECDAWRIQLHERFDAAISRTTLPERPDYAAANDWLLRARRSTVD